MKKSLTRRHPTGIYYVVDGERIEGCPPSLFGNVSSIRGDVSGISGDIDDCGLTPAERAAGIDIESLCAKMDKQTAE